MLHTADPTVHGYPPFQGMPELREAIADRYRTDHGVSLDPDTEIAVVPGTKTGIMLVTLACADTGDGVLLPDPGYPDYHSAVALAGARHVALPLDGAAGWQPRFAGARGALCEDRLPGFRVRIKQQGRVARSRQRNRGVVVGVPGVRQQDGVAVSRARERDEHDPGLRAGDDRDLGLRVELERSSPPGSARRWSRAAPPGTADSRARWGRRGGVEHRLASIAAGGRRRSPVAAAEVDEPAGCARAPRRPPVRIRVKNCSGSKVEQLGPVRRPNTSASRRRPIQQLWLVGARRAARARSRCRAARPSCRTRRRAPRRWRRAEPCREHPVERRGCRRGARDRGW